MTEIQNLNARIEEMRQFVTQSSTEENAGK